MLGSSQPTQSARLRLEERDTKRAAVARNPEPFLFPSSTAVSKSIMAHVITSGHCGAERPHFIDASVKLSVSTYQNLLRDDVLPHVYANAYSMDAVRSQQDGAPAHSARSMLAWLKERGIALLPWPANSPDLSPLDFFYWGRLEQELQSLYPGGFANEDEPRGGILRAAGRIPVEEVRKSIDSVLPLSGSGHRPRRRPDRSCAAVSSLKAICIMSVTNSFNFKAICIMSVANSFNLKAICIMSVSWAPFLLSNTVWGAGQHRPGKHCMDCMENGEHYDENGWLGFPLEIAEHFDKNGLPKLVFWFSLTDCRLL